jgi:hypothetical protein
MNQKIEKMKTHFRENKNVYIAVGISSAVTAASILLVLNRSESGAQIVQKITPVLSWRPESNNVIVEFLERSTPSKPVHLVGTNLYFNSIREAARETGHSISMISRNINGHIPDCKGDAFELLEPTA